MATSELLNSKAVKGLTKCSLWLLVFTVFIEGIVALVVAYAGLKEVYIDKLICFLTMFPIIVLVVYTLVALALIIIYWDVYGKKP